VEPKQDQDGDPELVQPHEDGVSAEGPPLLAAESLRRGEEHEQHGDGYQVAADARPPVRGGMTIYGG